MTASRPVVVYGASGYTGRLICEYLRELHVPFVAAGRDGAKVKEAMAHVPGIETAAYDVAEVAHDLDSLTALFSGASVVCNTVGPFSRFGPTVVEACLAAGVHYLDTTGEQDWMITCDERHGAAFDEAGLLLAPGIAQMYTTGEIAAELCLEQPGLDTLDICVFWGGSPTVASTETILFNAALSGAHYLEHNAYVPFDPDAGLYSVVIPGQHELGIALPWGGTSHPVWYRRDPRVANCKALGGVFDRALMQGVPQIVAAALDATREMAPEERDAALEATARQVMSTMPPRENPRVNKTLDSVHASGPLGRAHCVIHGNQNYKQTGLLQAYAAFSLLQQRPLRTGFASGCQAFGHRTLLGQLRAFGLIAEPVLTRSA
jgi:short subunit dehydrogenase-like uncharacterized protein